MGMPSEPGALWGRALERAAAISSSVIEGGEIFQPGIETLGYLRDQQVK